MNTNEQIRKFIDTNYNDFVATYNNTQFLHNYTGCNDYRLSEDLIEATWDYIVKEIFPTAKTGITSENPNYIKCLHTNSGAGKFLELAPPHLILTNIVPLLRMPYVMTAPQKIFIHHTLGTWPIILWLLL